MIAVDWCTYDARDLNIMIDKLGPIKAHIAAAMKADMPNKNDSIKELKNQISHPASKSDSDYKSHSKL